MLKESNQLLQQILLWMKNPLHSRAQHILQDPGTQFVGLKEKSKIYRFKVVYLVTRPMNESEAGVDHLIPFLMLILTN